MDTGSSVAGHRLDPDHVNDRRHALEEVIATSDVLFTRFLRGSMSCAAHLPPVNLNHISSTSILSAEHRVILQPLAVMDKMADRAAADRKIPVAHAEDALTFLRHFADKCHHGKEEDILFPALEAIHPGFGPAAVMREEHVEGRSYIAAIAAAVAANDVVGFIRSTKQYIGLLTPHIDKEDNILYRMADQMLSPEDDAALIEAYRRLEHDDMGSGTHERMLGLADSLALAYDVPRASAEPRIMELLTCVCGCKKP